MTDYKIQRGDTLAKIAEMMGTTVKKLQEANNIKNPNLIFAGKTLKMPDDLKDKKQTGEMLKYTINKGDTLSKIAQKTGTTVKQLQEANNIKDPNKIIAGKTLKIPTSGQNMNISGLHIEHNEAQTKYMSPIRPNGDAQTKYMPPIKPDGDAQTKYMPPIKPNGDAQTKYMPPIKPDGDAQTKYMPPIKLNGGAQTKYMPPIKP